MFPLPLFVWASFVISGIMAGIMLVVIRLLRLGFWFLCRRLGGYWMFVVVEAGRVVRGISEVWLFLPVGVMLLLWGVLYGLGVGLWDGGGVSGEVRGRCWNKAD